MKENIEEGLRRRLGPFEIQTAITPFLPTLYLLTILHLI